MGEAASTNGKGTEVRHCALDKALAHKREQAPAVGRERVQGQRQAQLCCWQRVWPSPPHTHTHTHTHTLSHQVAECHPQEPFIGPAAEHGVGAPTGAA